MEVDANGDVTDSIEYQLVNNANGNDPHSFEYQLEVDANGNDPHSFKYQMVANDIVDEYRASMSCNWNEQNLIPKRVFNLRVGGGDIDADDPGWLPEPSTPKW